MFVLSHSESFMHESNGVNAPLPLKGRHGALLRVLWQRHRVRREREDHAVTEVTEGDDLGQGHCVVRVVGGGDSVQSDREG
jgi:hypothetical protein